MICARVPSGGSGVGSDGEQHEVRLTYASARLGAVELHLALAGDAVRVGVRARAGAPYQLAERHGAELQAAVAAATGKPAQVVVSARHDPFDVRVHWNGVFAERNRRDRCGRIGTDARQAPETGFVLREAAQDRDRLRAGDQVARPGIIAEARPLLHDVGLRGGGEGFDGRPARDEAFEARRDGGDRGLLEHDFAQPDPIGVHRRRSGRGAPWQAPEVIHIMLQQPRCGIGAHGRPMA